MKNILLLITSVVLIFVASCSKNEMENSDINNRSSVAISNANDLTVYYFRGNDRCNSSLELSKLVFEALDENFRSKATIRFVEVNTTKAANKHLIEKFTPQNYSIIVTYKDKKYELSHQISDCPLTTKMQQKEQIAEEISKYLGI